MKVYLFKSDIYLNLTLYFYQNILLPDPTDRIVQWYLQV